MLDWPAESLQLAVWGFRGSPQRVLSCWDLQQYVHPLWGSGVAMISIALAKHGGSVSLARLVRSFVSALASFVRVVRSLASL